MRKLAIALLVFGLRLSMLGQGAGYTNTALTTVSTQPNAQVRVISYASIRVCTEPATGSPCTPLTNIYSDPALTIPLLNPMTADVYGNYTFYVAPGEYHLQISGAGATQQDLPYTAIGLSVNGSVLPGTQYQMARYGTTGQAISGDSLLTDNGTVLNYTGSAGITASGGFNGPTGNNTPSTGQFTNVNTTVMVLCPSCTDWGAAINAAIATCPTGYGSSASCRLVLPELNAAPWTTSVTLGSPNISLVGQGKTATNFSCTVAGDCLLVQPSTFVVTPGGEVGGFSIIGNGAAGQNTIHVRDTIARDFHNLFVDGASESGGACIWLEAYRYWSERNTFRDVQGGYNCNKTWKFSTPLTGNTNCNGTGLCSLGYNVFKAINANPNGAGQIGYSWEGRPYFYSESFQAQANKDTASSFGSTVFNVQDYSTLQGDIQFDGEDNAPSPSTQGKLWNITVNAIAGWYSGHFFWGGATTNTVTAGVIFNYPAAFSNNWQMGTNSSGVPSQLIARQPINIVSGGKLTIGTTGMSLDITGTNPEWCLYTSVCVSYTIGSPAYVFALPSQANALVIDNAGSSTAANNLIATNSVIGGSIAYIQGGYFKGYTANPGMAGIFRLASVDTIGWRNNANSSDLLLGKDASDRLTWNNLQFLDPSGNANFASIKDTGIASGTQCVHANSSGLFSGTGADCPVPLTGTTGSIGGSALTVGTCSSGTATVTGATTGHPVSVSASDGTLPNGLIVLSAAVTSSNTVTVQLCATGSVTPAAKTYNVVTQ